MAAAETKKIVDVIVIGAGSSGIAAARTCQEETKGKCSILVLEARQRVGGRSFTDDIGKSKIDLGGSWVHGWTTNNPIAQLAHKLAIVPFTVDRSRQTLLMDEIKGQQVPAEDLLEAYQLVDMLRQETLHVRATAIAENKQDRSVADAFTDIQLAVDQSRHKRIVELVRAQEEQHFGASWHQLSLLHWDDSIDMDGPDQMFQDGYGSLIAHAAARDLPNDQHLSPLDIRLGEVVTRIDSSLSDTTVLVQTQKAEYVGKHVICTLPLGVLQSGTVTFNPPLPISHSNAIGRLGVSLMNKLVLLFDKQWWSDAIALIGIVSKTREKFQWWYNLQPLQKAPILVCLITGDFARQVEKMDDREVVQQAMAYLRSTFRKNIPDPIDYKMTRWLADPFARGSYTHFAVGSSASDIQTLQQGFAHDRIFLAGEHVTELDTGTIHGAWSSGVQQAKKIMTKK